MPRLGVALRGGKQVLYEPKAENCLPNDLEKRIREEWEARCGVQALSDLVIQYHQASGNAPAADPHNTDPGAWLEAHWRCQLYEQGLGAFLDAEALRGFHDSARPLSRDEQAKLGLKIQEDEQQARMAGRPMDMQRHESTLTTWWGLDGKARARTLSNYINTAMQCRPHGFSSVGRVPADSPMGRLLLHGLHVFLATCFDPAALVQLHTRHHRSVVINTPTSELLQYQVTYSNGMGPSTFTGALPPVAAQVPLFDHLSLHWQLQYVSDVLTGTIASGDEDSGVLSNATSAVLPADHVYNWSAFNKLLLLGMYAPVEEAHTCTEPAQAQLVKQQLQQLQAARQVDSATALSSLQQSLASFRCVLHDQLAAEIAVGQAALQLFAATQQERQRRQPHPDQQYTHEQMAQLQRQLQECHLSAFLGQHTSGSNGSSSSGGCDGTAAEQEQQLVLLVCSLLAWPLMVMSPTLFDAAYPSLHQHQRRQQQQGVPGAATHAQPFCTAQLCQLLQAAVAGICPEGNSSNLSPRSQGVKGILLRALNLDVGPEQQEQLQQQQPQQQQDRQQQQQDRQQGAQQDPQQLLVAWLLQLLVQQWERTPSASSAADAGQQGDSTAAASGSSDSAAAATGGVGVCSDPVAGVQLAAFTRGLCNLLVLRLLSRAPPCESWSWEACLAVTQLVASSEQAAAAAGVLMYQAITQLQTSGVEEAFADPGQQQAVTPTTGPYHHSSSRQAELHDFAVDMLTVLQQLQKAEEALLACTSSSNSNNGGRSARSQHQGLHNSSTSNNSRVRSSSRSKTWAPQQLQQQQSLHAFGVPTFWRSQVLNQYRDTRKDGYSWMQKCFADVVPGNCKPGFWGLLGKFAAADQLNLRHAEAPTALAAVPSTVQVQQDPRKLAQNDWQAPQAILAKQLARTANMQLRQKDMQQLAANAGIPVQLHAVKTLMQCAFLAAQQPQLLAYSIAQPRALQESAAAAAAQGPPPDDEGDVFLSPCPSPEPAVIIDSLREALSRNDGSAGAGAAAAAAAVAAGAWGDVTGFHLSSVVALGPSFEESQQGPCLARFMQLLLQYHADTAAAACSALQRLQPELQKQGLWVPQHTGGTASANSTSTSSSRSEGGYVPAERSRLLVLLMGLYHLQMLDEQQSRQRKQQWEQQQQEREQQWAAQQQGSVPQKSLQQDEATQQQPHPQQLRAQQRQQVRLTRSASGESAAAATASDSAASVYSDMQACQQFAATAAESAYAMPDLLAYCLLPLDRTCGVTHGAAQQGSSSGRAQQGSQQQQQQQRFEVCSVSTALVRDGVAIMKQPPLEVWDLPPNALCDACSTSTVAQRVGIEMTMGFYPGPPNFQAALGVCTSCGSAHLCKACGPSSSDAWRQHERCCPALHEALEEVTTHAAATAGLVPKLVGHTHVYEACGCNRCDLACQFAREWQELRLHCNPLVQYAGPWGPSHAQVQAVGSLLPLSLCRDGRPGDADLEKRAPAVKLFLFTWPLVEMGREWLQHAGDPESAEAVAARRKMVGSSAAPAAAADAGSSSSQQGQGSQHKAGNSSSSWAAEPPAAAPAAAGCGMTPSGSPAARGGVPAGLGSSLAPRRREQQQRKQQQQQQDNVFSRMGNLAQVWGSALGLSTVDDPTSPLSGDDDQWCRAFSEFAPPGGKQDLNALLHDFGLGEVD